MPNRDIRRRALDRETPSDRGAGRAEVEQRLVAAGLAESGRLGSVGVERHLRRFDRGAVARDRLLRHAENVERLVERTERLGARLPSTLWDVESGQRRRAGLDVYRIAECLASPAHAEYVELLARSYRRFQAFKALEGRGEDTALDAALDLVEIVGEAVAGTPALGRLESGRIEGDETAATLYVWQNLLTSFHRRNPLTGRPLFSHGLLDHLNLPAMHRHVLARRLTAAETWGVTGLHPRFVGPARNVNQVEHLAISLTLQSVGRTPLFVLDLVEWAQVLLTPADFAEGRADRALNRAVREAFVPRFRADLAGAVEALREALRG